MSSQIFMEYGPNRGANIVTHCLNCESRLPVLKESNFCNQTCEDEYYYQEEYVCSCFNDDEPDVDELQENQDFAQDDILGYQDE